MQAQDNIQLAIVDDEQLMVTLLKSYFNNQEGIHVLMTDNSGEQFLDQLEQSETLPNVVIMDLRMAELDGAETTAIIKEKYPSVKVIVVSSYYKKSFMGYMLKTGVSAFLPKGILPDELLEVVQNVYRTGYYFLPDQVEIIRGQVTTRAPKPKFTLEASITSREKEILSLICQQHTAQEIADKLFIAKRTVEGHKNRLLSKTGVKNTAGLVIYAIQKRIVDISTIH